MQSKSNNAALPAERLLSVLGFNPAQISDILSIHAAQDILEFSQDQIEYLRWQYGLAN